MKLQHWGTAALTALCVAISVQAEPLTGTLKKIKDSGSITLGVRDSAVPFSYMDDKQTYRGYSVDLCMRIVDAVKKKLGMNELKVKLLPITPATRIPLLVNQTIDITCGSDANTPVRQRQVAFSWTTFIGNEAMVTRKSENIHDVTDLKGKTVVTVSGASEVKLINDINQSKGLGMHVLLAPDHASAFMMIESGRANAFIMTDILVASEAASSKNPNNYAVTLIKDLPVEPWGLMLRRNDPSFRKTVDDVLSEMFRSGEMKALYRRWFESPLPTLGVNLRIPMSPKLQNAIATPNDSGNPKDYK